MKPHPIEWCDLTKNPFHGCQHGCPYCYARDTAERLSHIPNSGHYWHLREAGFDFFKPVFDKEKLEKMVAQFSRSRTSKVIFLGSMGDIGGNFDYLVPTPEPTYIGAFSVRNAVRKATEKMGKHTVVMLTKNPTGLQSEKWPDNVCLGVSVTSSRDAINRVPRLMEVECGSRCVSVEPLFDEELDPSLLRGVDWVKVGAVTGDMRKLGISQGIVQAAKRIVEWGKSEDVPVFIKANLREVAPDVDWPMERLRRSQCSLLKSY